LSRLFISHSSADSVAAIAFKQWLGTNGWPKEDVFLDVEDIGGGERWKDALRKAHSRCEAVILLASPDALASPECLTEVRKAEDFGKDIIVVLLRDLTVDDRRLDSYKERQIVDLSVPPLAHIEQVDFRGTRHEVRFNGEALAKVKDYLVRRGITPESFPWPPEGKAEADPFPGLSAFTEDDAAIFFGRDTDILTGLDEFRLLRRKGSPRFLAIQAASGAGKSSFLRAGLWPRLNRDPDFAALAILRPAQGILTGPEGLGQKLAKQLTRPGATINPGDIYTQLMADNAAAAAAAFAKLMGTAAEQAHDQRRIGNPDAPVPALVFAIDQAEELLAPENETESRRFLALLHGVMREPPPGVDVFGLLTVRADSATRLYQAMADLNFEVPKPLMLLPLPRTSYRDVIVKPVDLVARRGQKIAISPALADRLVVDAAGADALPLLAFTLLQLYRGFGAGGSITLDQYEAIGGVAGSIKEAIKQALARPGDAPAIPAANDEQLACLRSTFIPWLARVDPESGEAMRRTARLDEFVGTSRAMVERLTEKRLLVGDRRAGADVVEVAHESLLRQWPPLTGWLQAVGDDLRVVDGVERASGEWVRNGRLPAWLDHRGDRLSAAEKLAKREDFHRRLGDDGLAYLKACRVRENAQLRIMQAIKLSAAAVLVMALGIGFLVYKSYQSQQQAARARKEAEVSLLIGQSQTNLSVNYGGVATALDQALRAYKLIDSTASRSALLQALMEISPHAAALFPIGSDTVQALAWMDGGHFEVATGAGKRVGRLRTVDATKATNSAAARDQPSIERTEDGNWSAIRALAPLGTEQMIAVFDEGTVGVYQRGKSDIQLQPRPSDISVNPIQHAVAISHSGAVIALATVDESITLYRCDWRASPEASACSSTHLGEARGRAVAISPDEKRIAVGDRSGKVMVYDLAGKPIGSAAILDAPINALGWAEQRDWLAAGTTTGEIAVFDAGAEQISVVTRQTFGSNSITALAWSPTELSLAFVCNGTAVCLLRSSSDAHASEPFKPAMRFEGHGGAVTRLSFAPTGAQLASDETENIDRGPTHNMLRVWSLAQDTDVASTLYADEAVQFEKVAVSPDRRWIAAGSTDGAIEFWDAKTGASERTVRPSGDAEVDDIAWNHAGSLASIHDHTTVSVIAAGVQEPAITVPLKTHAGYHLAWTDQDRMIAVPTGEGGVLLLDPHSPDAKAVRLDLADGKDVAWGVASIPGSRSLLVSYVGGAIRAWDLSSKPAAPSTPFARGDASDKIGVGSLSVSPDLRMLATSSGDGSVPIYDISKRAVGQTLKTDSPGISAVAFSPNGQKLAALGSDNWLYVWTLEPDTAELYLAVPAIPRRAVVGDAAHRSEQTDWLDWVSDDRIAVATSIAAISILRIDPARWLKRIDALALEAKAPIN
jgi:WD40 repeat protein